MNKIELWNKIKGFPLNNKQKLDLLDAISEVINRILNVGSDNPDNPDNPNNPNNNDNANDKYICFKLNYTADVSPLYKDIMCTIPYNGELTFATDYWYMISSEELLGISLKDYEFNANIEDVDFIYNLFKNYKVIYVSTVDTSGISIANFSGLNVNYDGRFGVIFTYTTENFSQDINISYDGTIDKFKIYVPSPMESPV